MLEIPEIAENRLCRKHTYSLESKLVFATRKQQTAVLLATKKFC